MGGKSRYGRKWHQWDKAVGKADILRRLTRPCLSTLTLGWRLKRGIMNIVSYATSISILGCSDIVTPRNTGCARGAMSDMCGGAILLSWTSFETRESGILTVLADC